MIIYLRLVIISISILSMLLLVHFLLLWHPIEDEDNVGGMGLPSDDGNKGTLTNMIQQVAPSNVEETRSASFNHPTLEEVLATNQKEQDSKRKLR